jgi:phage gpG-like protein
MKLAITNNNIAEQLTELLLSVKVDCQAAMANRFAAITQNNFGFDGEDRPEQWPALSVNYANKFHDGQRIPTEILSGDLQASIQIEETNPEYAEVFTDVPYAVAQQEGEEAGNLPARPYMPVNKDGTFPAYTLEEVTAAARNELFRSLA